MNVTFETTPNPATMKFVFSKKISDHSVDFPNVEAAERSPLAAKIFGFPWTSSVFLGENFVTVTKQDWVEWEILASPLAGLLGEHIERGEPVLLNPEIDSDSDTDLNGNDISADGDVEPSITKSIKRLLRTEIKPVVALDGGDVAFVKYENNVLYLKMLGSCSGCPSSQATLKDGIEVRFKQAFPEIIEVVAV